MYNTYVHTYMCMCVWCTNIKIAQHSNFPVVIEICLLTLDHLVSLYIKTWCVCFQLANWLYLLRDYLFSYFRASIFKIVSCLYLYSHAWPALRNISNATVRHHIFTLHMGNQLYFLYLPHSSRSEGQPQWPSVQKHRVNVLTTHC